MTAEIFDPKRYVVIGFNATRRQVNSGRVLPVERAATENIQSATLYVKQFQKDHKFVILVDNQTGDRQYFQGE
jgi:hypothetical protein